jgi:hypothetical protein
MSNCEIKRDHLGVLHLYVAGIPALGVTISGISTMNDGGLSAIAVVPLRLATIGEVDTVIPMRKAA